MKWIGQHIYDLVAKFRGADGSSVTIDSNSNRPLKIYQPVVDASPGIRIGGSDTEMLQIRAFYQSGTQEMQVASFSTKTAETDADRGKFQFTVDGTNILDIDDDGIDLYTGKGIAINGTDILTDSSGTATLSNIDALDATTISTLNSALTAGDITGVTAGTGLSGGGTSGAVTLNVDAAQTQITSVGTIGTGTWQSTAIASAYLDADTAHLSGQQIFTGSKKFNEIRYAIFAGDKDVTPGDGAVIHVDTHDVTDTATSGSGTAAMYTHVSIESPRLLATNSSVTTTAAATLYISNAPAASTNQTITNAYALWVDAGLVKFDGALTVGGTITGDVTGDLTGEADTVATIAGLAPNTATTQATQGGITSCANLVTVGTIGTGVWNATAIASAKMATASASAQGAVELATTAEADSGTDTARAVTPEGLKSHVDARYARSTITFATQATMLSSGNWVTTGQGGISNHSWNQDMGVNTETNGTSAGSLAKQYGHMGIRVPYACVIENIYAAIRNSSGNRQATVGLFCARAADGTTAVDWGTTDATEPILQIHADANNESGSYQNRPTHAEASVDVVMAAGDMFYPALKLTGVTSSGNTDTVLASFSVGIKTLIA